MRNDIDKQWASAQYCTVLCNIYILEVELVLVVVVCGASLLLLVFFHYEILSVELPNMKPIMIITILSAHPVHDPSPRLHCFCGSNLEVSY